MATSNIRPSTLAGIKRLATSIKREKCIPHSGALDVAAQQAGFQNFRHARCNMAERAVPLTPLHMTYVTAYWRADDGATGRETLAIQSRVKWPIELSPSELQRVLPNFRVDAVDHFETREDI